MVHSTRPNRPDAPPAALQHARAATGELSALVARHDWSSSPLGPRDQWPSSLATVVQILLGSRYAMWMGWGPDLTFFYNDAYRPTLGVKHPWALGRPAREVWAEIWPDIGPRIRAVLETGAATWDEGLLLFLERSGYAEETYHTFSYSPLLDDTGAVAGMLCVVTEETERIIGARRLESLNALSSALAATTNEPDVLAAVERSVGHNRRDLPFTLLYLTDADGTRARRACCTGIAVDHAAAPPTIALGDPAAPWPLTQVIASGASVVIDSLADHHDLPSGAWETPPHRAVLVPITQPGERRPAGFLIVGLNPFRQFDAAYAGFVQLLAGQVGASLANVRAYEAERARAAALAELDRVKTDFFSNVSHEFRTPLTLLLGPLEELMRRSDLPPTAQGELVLAQRNGLRLLKLVNTLLDFSRIEAGRIDAVYEPTDLSSFTAELASAFRSAVERAGLSLIVDTPPLDSPVYVDRDMWEKIILNLLSNAFKHTFEGSIAVRVRASDGRIQVAVTDTGAGIPEADVPRLFERFHRVQGARRRTHEGTGIGLALVQELVRHHGGQITASSREGVGTTFTVTLPLGTAHLPADRIRATPPDGADRQLPRSTATGTLPYVAEALRWLPAEDDEQDADDAAVAIRTATGTRAPAASRPPAPAAVSDARILLADDNADMRAYVARLLRGAGWRVQTVGDGMAALAAARADPPDLVLSDVMMPALDGFALLKELRADPRTSAVPLILLSARAGEDARVEGAQAGADDYLVKPFAAEELVARVGGQLVRAKERARVAVEIAAARDLLTEVLAQAPVAISVLRGPDHIFELANQFQERLIANRQLIGRRAADAVHELVGQGIIQLLDRVYATGEPYVARAMPLRIDRLGNGQIEEVVVTFLLYPFRAPSGQVIGVIAVTADVTDEVMARREADKAREEAERARASAEHANRAKSQFLAVMSHELRTPLNAIAGHVQLMQMGLHGPITDGQVAALSRIERGQRHLLRLINDVLNLARIETGRLEYAIEDVVLQDVVAELAPMVEPQLAAKALAYRLRLPPEPVVVRADREKLSQILLNLVSNACKFTPSRGTVTIHVPTPTRVGGRIFVQVADTGVGVPLDKQDQIFEPFVQVQAGPTRTAEGAGLGLAISRDLARGMGGDLRVRSRPGRGATFTLELPGRAARLDAAADAPVADAPPA